MAHAPHDRIVDLPARTLQAMRLGLPELIDAMVRTVVAEVPALAVAARESWRPVMVASAEQLLGALLDQLHTSSGRRTPQPMPDILETARRFGRREARNGRPTEVQLAAYRVGARELWREWSALAVRDEVDREQISVFAEMFFAYLDQISAAGAAGYAEEQARAGRDRERQRERLVRLLIGGSSTERLAQAAEDAAWTPPRTLTAVAMPNRAPGNLGAVTSDPRTLHVPEDAVDVAAGARIVLVCDVGGASRAAFLSTLSATRAVVGPAREWTAVRSSIDRVVRAASLRGVDGSGLLDTDEYLLELVLSADADASGELRARALAPLAALPAAARDRLVETLRSWLLHHGRRDDVAADLIVSPSTIRYRLRQIRSAYGDELLRDPRTIAELTTALAVPASAVEG